MNCVILIPEKDSNRLREKKRANCVKDIMD